MNSEKLMDAIGNIDLEIVEQFILMDLKLQNKEHIHKRKTWISIAACLGLCVALSLSVAAVVKHLQGTKVPISQEAVYSAEEIRELFVGRSFLCGPVSSYYDDVYVPSEEELQIVPIPEEEYIAIYENAGKELDEEELRSFVDGFSDRLSEALGDEMPEYTVEDNSDISYLKDLESFVNIGEYTISIRQTGDRNRVTIYPTSNEMMQIVLDGQVVQVDQRQSDEEIIESLSDVKKKLFQIFGVKYKDVKVVRRYDKDSEYGADGIQIYFYDADAHLLNELGEMPVTDYIEVNFHNYNYYSDKGNQLGDGILMAADIMYTQSRNKDISVMQCGRISLSEAEALLAKGYVFEHHYCPLCNGRGDYIDMTQYDFVSLIYLLEDVKEGEETTKITAIPFYVFYKYIGESENGNQSYAMTYVPAIELSGWDEYFENQIQDHENYEEWIEPKSGC